MITTKKQNNNNFKLIMEGFRNWSSKTEYETKEIQFINESRTFLSKKYGFSNVNDFDTWTSHHMNDYGRLILKIEAVEFLKENKFDEKGENEKLIIQIFDLKNKIRMENIPSSIKTLSEGLKLDLDNSYIYKEL